MLLLYKLQHVIVLACLKHLRIPHFMQYSLQRGQRAVGLQGLSKGFGSFSTDVVVLQTATRDYELVLKHLRTPHFLQYSLQQCQRAVGLQGLSKGFGSFIADVVVVQTKHKLFISMPCCTRTTQLHQHNSPQLFQCRIIVSEPFQSIFQLAHSPSGGIADRTKGRRWRQ